jgi:hypothetical protein
MFEIYAEAVKNNITVVGGGDIEVGIGGWITGGGHSPISSKFGLGADQVLEMEVVTADGELRTINAITNPDLFWAMRGVSSQLQFPKPSSNRLKFFIGRRINIWCHCVCYSKSLSVFARSQLPFRIQHDRRFGDVLVPRRFLSHATPVSV